MLRFIHHQNVTVSDIERSKRFYRDVLGLEVTNELDVDHPEFGRGVGVPGAKVKAVFLATPEGRALVELLQYVPADAAPLPERRINDVALGHLAFRVDDIQGVYEHLKGQGVEFVSSPVHLPGDVYFCYFRDPDGLLLEIIQTPE